MANLIQQSPDGGVSYGGVLNYYDAMMDDINKVQFFPFGQEYFDEMNQILNYIGQRDIAKQPIVKWFERERQEVPFTSNTTVAIASGVYTITLPAAEVDPTTGYSWPIEREIYRHAPSGQLFQIISKPAANTLVLRPINTGWTQDITAQDKFFIVGNSQPEGSDMAATQTFFSTMYSAYVQTQRNDFEITSEGMYDQLWYNESEDGKSIPFSNSDDSRYVQREHLVRLVNTFLAGQTSNNLSSTTSFQTTAGMIPTIFERGQTQDTMGNLDAADFYALEEKLTQQDGSVKDYAVWTTDRTSSQLEQSLMTYNQNVNIQLNRVEMGKTFFGSSELAEMLSTTYSFQAMVINNKNFGITRMGVFDNPQTFGVDGSTWKNYAVVIPMTRSGNGVTDGYGNQGKYIRVTHKPGAFMNMYTTGGRSPINKTTRLNLVMTIWSEVAYKFICANKMGLFYSSVEP